MHISTALNLKTDLQTFDKRIYERIVDTLRGVMNRYGKDYCYPSQETLLRLLRRNQQTIISRRTLNRHLRTLENMGVINRIRRYRTLKDGSKVFQSTAYYVGAAASGLIFQAAKALRRIASLGRVPKTAHYLLKEREYKHKDDKDAASSTYSERKRWPQWLQDVWRRKCSGEAATD